MIVASTSNTTTVGEIIPLEHERRFFPNLKTFEFDITLYKKKEILQGYLEDKLGTRLRKECEKEGIYVYWQTRKTGKGVSRSEDEQSISKEIFDLMWANIICSLIKTRYFMPWNDVIVEINIFHGGLKGYIQIEVEFETHEEAVAFVPPEWFGIEVTDDSRHGNYALAKYGCKDFCK